MASETLATLLAAPDLAPDVEAAVTEGLSVYAEAHPAGGGLTLLHGLAAVGPPALAAQAEAAIWRLEERGHPCPSWATGRAELVRAWIGADALRDRETVVAEFRHPGQPAHTLSLLTDPNRKGLLEDVILTGDAAHTRRSLAGAGLVDGFRTTAPDQLAGRLRRGLELADEQAGAVLLDTQVASLRALLYARLRDLPAPRAVGDRWAPVSESARWGLVDRFLQSPEAAGLTGADLVVRCAVDYKLDWGDGDPLRWSPEVVNDFLHGWLPQQEMTVVTTATPAHLRAWVRYAGRLAGLYPAYVEATAAAVTQRPGHVLRPLTGWWA
jgi:hypothetical protein